MPDSRPRSGGLGRRTVAAAAGVRPWLPVRVPVRLPTPPPVLPSGLVLALLLASGVAVATSPPDPAGDGATPVPADLRLLPLEGPVATPDAEISAMCWCGDLLVLVPQHPERFGDRDDALVLFGLERRAIEAALDADHPAPLTPRRVVLEAPGLPAGIPGWEGFEAAVALGDTVFLAVESRADEGMAGHLLRGRAHREGADGLRLVIDTDRVVPVPVPVRLPNMSQEALVVHGERLVVLFEANGVNVNPGARVAFFDLDLGYLGSAPMDPVEYRITDASEAAPGGAFWVINYFYPGERDVLSPPGAQDRPVEHLLELRFDGERVSRSGRPALDLRRDDDVSPARNWEALVRLSGRGFLLMTDRYPTTLLAFVPLATTIEDEP
jgi:hypothetical protein